MPDTPEPPNQADAATKPFDEAAWMEQLLKLNPWARGLEIDERNEEFRTARESSSRRRWSAGLKQWNEWAERCLALSAAASASKCNASVDRLARSLCLTNLIGYQFDEDSSARLSQAKFPGAAWFSRATFNGEAWFQGATFTSDAWFDGATFNGDAWFHGVTFTGDAHFSRAAFNGDVWFSSAVFIGNTTFQGATFTGDVSLHGATLTGDAWFGGAKFQKSTNFGPLTLNRATNETARNPVTFNKRASFKQCAFSGPVTMAHARFADEADFSSIHSKVAFSLADTVFAKFPDFTEASFHEAPRLDNITVREPISESHLFNEQPYPDDPRPPGLLRMFALARDEHEHARLRTLRKLAGDAKDHENELKFNAWEISARRFWVDHPWRNPGRFWLGWLYGLTSSYGLSIARPLVGWAASLVVFWGIYFFATLDLPKLAYGEKCHPSYVDTTRITDPVTQAFALSLRNSTIIDRNEPAAARRMYGCLYGLQVKESERHNPPAAALPVIPTSVVFLSSVQTVISAIFLFLAGLGLRNMFRMK